MNQNELDLIQWVLDTEINPKLPGNADDQNIRLEVFEGLSDWRPTICLNFMSQVVFADNDLAFLTSDAKTALVVVRRRVRDTLQSMELLLQRWRDSIPE